MRKYATALGFQKKLGGEVMHLPDVDVRLYHDDRKGVYAVQYGLQIDCELTYWEAATKLGEDIMHALVCEGGLN